VLIQLQAEYARLAKVFKTGDASNVTEFAKCLVGACEVVSTYASEPSARRDELACAASTYFAGLGICSWIASIALIRSSDS
jgi:hypothetical protein